MTVSEIMNKNVVSVSPEESVSLASRLLSRHNIGSLPVIDDGGRLLGVITDRDIVLRCVANGRAPDATFVKDVMTKSLITASPADDVKKAAKLMSSGQVRRLPVTDNGRVVGMVSLGDMAVRDELNMEASDALSDISSHFNRR